MEKTLTIGGRQVQFKSTGAFLLRYKMQFGRDPIQDVFKMKDAIGVEDGKKVINVEVVDMEIFFSLVWTLAKTADPASPEPLEWLDSFDTFPLDYVLPELQDLMLSSFVSTVEPKKK
jgi:hypothetical protein